MKNIYLSDFTIPKFAKLINPILDNEVHEVLLTGGRGSIKSSFFSLIIPFGMMEDYHAKGQKTHAVVLRQVGNTLRKTVFNQLEWGLIKLGVKDDWECTTSPMKMVYKPSGQEIVFSGCDDPLKLKATKFTEGYCKYGWFEEFDQFESMKAVRNVCQSIFRGGEGVLLMSMNPPPINEHWANREALIEKKGRIHEHSTYLEVPYDWLGKTFHIMADDLKDRNKKAYDNEYLGIVTGIGGNIFKNVNSVTITDDIVLSYDFTRHGLDFGFTIDPTAYNEFMFSADKREINAFFELHEYGLGTGALCSLLRKRVNRFKLIKADSQESRTINTMQTEYGINVIGCKKGQDSVRHGVEWLADLRAINIDRKRCPETYFEFISYSFEKDKNGKWIKQYPDKDNHHIDSIRYGLDDVILQSGWRVPKAKRK